MADASIAVISGLALALTALFICVVPLTGNIAGARDFVVYWATGQQLARHANPYDGEAMGRIEHSAGLSAGYGVLFMRNPPWALPLAYPLGFIGLRMGALLWSLLLLGCLAASVRILWLMQGRPGNRVHWLGLSFAPGLVCLIVGQTSLFSLLGYVLFLRFHGTRPFVAGVCLWLCALKPHLFLPFGVVLLAWIGVSGSYRVLGGALAALGGSCAAGYWMWPAGWQGYFAMMRGSTVETEFIPCLSDALRLWVRPQAVWMQYLPAAVACAWALWFYWIRRRRWDWMNDGAGVMLASILAAPYCWLYDQALLIPALLRGAYLTRVRMLLPVLALASFAVYAALVGGVRITAGFYLWTVPMWLAWYLAACGWRGPKAGEQA